MNSNILLDRQCGGKCHILLETSNVSRDRLPRPRGGYAKASLLTSYSFFQMDFVIVSLKYVLRFGSLEVVQVHTIKTVRILQL